MKPKLIFLFLCLILVAACSDDVDPDITLTTSSSVSMEADEGASATVSFTSATDWSASVDEEWLTCSPSSGSGGTYTIALTCTEENSSITTRTATLTIVSGNITQSVTITQDECDYVTLEEDTYNVSAEGDTLTVYFTTNVDIDDLLITASSFSSGSLQVSTRAATTNSVEVTIPANTSTASRTAYLYFYMQDGLKRVLLNTATFVQEGAVAVDKSVTVLQTATSGSGLPIVLMGDGFTASDITGGTYAEVMEKAMENIFSEEPLASLQSYFNVYSITAVSTNSNFTGSTVFGCTFGSGSYISVDENAVKTYVRSVDGVDWTEALAVVILNSTRYGGTTSFGYTNNGTVTDFAIARCPTIYGVDNEMFREVLVHEAVGHGFAKLADEYSYESYGTIPEETKIRTQNRQASYGWFLNVDFTTDESEVLWSTFLSDETYAADSLGIYEGGYTYYKGVYRPSKESMMNQNNTPFNPPSRKLIYDRVMEDGAGTTPTYDDFVAFDLATFYANGSSSSSNLKSTRVRSASVASEGRFAPPQIVSTDLSDQK